MNYLTKEELTNVTGGGISLGIAALIGAIVTFAIGVIDGFTRPLKCYGGKRFGTR